MADKDDIIKIHKKIKFQTICPICDTEIHFSMWNIIFGFSPAESLMCPYCTSKFELTDENMQHI